MRLFSFILKNTSKSNKFEALFSIYEKPLLYYIRKIIYDKSYDEDALQETFMQVYRNLDKIGEVDSVRTRNYLYVIAKNMALEFNRKIKHQQDVTKPYDENIIMVEDRLFMESVSVATISEKLEESLDQLGDSDKEIISLKYGLELNDSEIADILHIKNDAVRQRVSRARRRLVAIFKEPREEE
jgi:RNA polymerase sigma-70 factor (ECF subfamily)